MDFVGFLFVKTFLCHEDVIMVVPHLRDEGFDTLAHNADSAMALGAVTHFLTCGETDFDVFAFCKTIHKGQFGIANITTLAVDVIKSFPLF